MGLILRRLSLTFGLALTGAVACKSSSSGAPIATTDSGTPSTPVATATIGSAGGIVSAPGDAVSLVIPAGALSAETPITITPVASAPAGHVGAVYEIEPTGTQFAVPVSLLFTVSEADLGDIDPNTLTVATLSGGEWTSIAGVVSPDHRQVAAQITHLSPYTCATARDHVCQCDTGCFARACQAANLQLHQLSPDECRCGGVAKPDMTVMWSAEDAKQSCDQTSIFGDACTPCIKKCVRDAGGWIGTSNDSICQWAVAPALFPATAWQSTAACVASCKDPHNVCGKAVTDAGPPKGDASTQDAGVGCTSQRPCTVTLAHGVLPIPLSPSHGEGITATIRDADGNLVSVTDEPIQWTTSPPGTIGAKEELSPQSPTYVKSGVSLIPLHTGSATITATLAHGGSASLPVLVSCGTTSCSACPGATDGVCTDVPPCCAAPGADGTPWVYQAGTGAVCCKDTNGAAYSCFGGDTCAPVQGTHTCASTNADGGIDYRQMTNQAPQIGIGCTP